jgi:hypothetical protein
VARELHDERGTDAERNDDGEDKAILETGGG